MERINKEQQEELRSKIEYRKMRAINEGRISDKSYTVLLITGLFCLDKFYLGRPLLGLIKILSLGGLMMWWIIDLMIIISGNSIDRDGNRVIRQHNRIKAE